MSTAAGGGGGDDVQLVTFKVAGQDFAFNIFKWNASSGTSSGAASKTPDFLEGVLRYQGRAVPLIDLRKRLNFPRRSRKRLGR